MKELIFKIKDRLFYINRGFICFLYLLLLCSYGVIAQVNINIPNIPKGKTICITFETEINNPLTMGTDSVKQQGEVSGDNFMTIPTDDPDTPKLNDSTATLVVGEADIVIEGNMNVIPDGQMTTMPGDNTDFGNTVSGTPVINCFTIMNTGGDTLFITDTTIIGTDATFFTFSSLESDTILSGESAVMCVEYLPTAEGNHSATVNVFNNTMTIPQYDFAISGSSMCNDPTITVMDDCLVGSATFCFDEFPDMNPAPARRDHHQNRGDDIDWQTDGSGTFSNPTGPDPMGRHCIEFSGGQVGDMIIAINTSASMNGCPSSDTIVYDPQIDMECPFLVAENYDFNADVYLDDPCNCGDGQNFTSDSDEYFFHDVLTVSGPPGVAVTFSNEMNWFDENGQPVNGPIGITTDANGMAMVDFYRPAGIAMTTDVTVGQNEPVMFVSSVCSICNPIPTIGEWGMICLALILMISGIVFIKNSWFSVRRSISSNPLDNYEQNYLDYQ